MEAAFVALTLLALAVLSLGVWQRRKFKGRLDHLANRVSGEPGSASASPSIALLRLEALIEDQSDLPQQPGGDKRFKAGLQAIDHGVIVANETGEVVFCNASASWYDNSRHGEAVVAQKVDDLIRAAVQGLQATENVVLFGPPRRTLNVSALPLVDNGEQLGAIAFVQDITAAEQSETTRRDFVANISHELRTPIGAVSLLAETLVDEGDPEVIGSLAKRLRTETQRLAATVEDLLELSRIEHSGNSAFATIDFKSVIDGAHSRVAALAQHKEVGIELTVPNKPLFVRGDQRQLTSAVFNLLDNAVKFSSTQQGKVEVVVSELGNDLEVVVRDNGIGISRQHLSRIFERFYRVDQGRDRGSGGSGLGLAIVRHIIVNHGGSVEATSTEGEGTTLTVLLPLAPEVAQPGNEVAEGNTS